MPLPDRGAPRALDESRSENVFGDFKKAYTREQAVLEANRCLFCSDAPCVKACPTSIDIPQFIRKIATGNVHGSAKTIFEANVLGTWNLLEAVRREAPRARLLVVGTGESYGPQPEGTRVTEEAPFRPVSPYAFSKAAADAGAAACAAAWGLDVVRIRAFSHTGPGQTVRFAAPSFAEQIAAIEAGAREPVLEVGNLDVTRDLLDVRDVVEAYGELLVRGRSGSAYNVCRGEGVRLTDLVQGLAERARVQVRIEVQAARVRPADVPYLVGDPSALEREVGWRARIPLARTLDDLLQEWRLARSPGS